MFLEAAHNDFETRSRIDLKRCGAYVYAEDPSTDVLMFSYASATGPVTYWQPDMPAPKDFFDAPHFIAFNAAFERAIWHFVMHKRYGWPKLPPLNRWSCAMAIGQSYGLPGALEQQAQALHLKINKDKEGYRLINLFCKPSRKGQFIESWEAPDDWRRFGLYNQQDVKVERALLHALPAPHLSDNETLVWRHQMRINERGIGADLGMARVVSAAAKDYVEHLNQECVALTGLRGTQREKLLGWLNSEGLEIDNMQGTTLREMIGTDLPSDVVRRVIEIRQATSKTSIKKYDTLIDRTSSDGRLRGSMVYHGASTGRVAHKGFQTGNLPRGEIKYVPEMADCLEFIGDWHSLALLNEPMTAYSAMTRSALIASPGNLLFSGDYAQIEARMNAYLSGEYEVLLRFARGEDLYRAMASVIWKIPAEEVTARQRQIAKSAFLGAQYGLGWKSFIDYCWKQAQVRVEKDEAKIAVSTYRESSPAVVQNWRDTVTAARNAVRCPGEVFECSGGRIHYALTRDRKWLIARLPSGRRLHYLRPRFMHSDRCFRCESEEIPPEEIIVENGECLTCHALGREYKLQPKLVCDGMTKDNFWGYVNLWHGTLVNNNTQAATRDIMAHAGLRLEAAGFPIVLSVHDELVADAPEKMHLEDMLRIMAEPVPWAPGLPTKVEGWSGRRYRK